MPAYTHAGIRLSVEWTMARTPRSAVLGATLDGEAVVFGIRLSDDGVKISLKRQDRDRATFPVQNISLSAHDRDRIDDLFDAFADPGHDEDLATAQGRGLAALAALVLAQREANAAVKHLQSLGFSAVVDRQEIDHRPAQVNIDDLIAELDRISGEGDPV
jgi:hypothetical protein